MHEPASSSAREPARGASTGRGGLEIERLPAGDRRVGEAQMILDEAFPDGGHKVDEEVARSWGTVWVANLTPRPPLPEGQGGGEGEGGRGGEDGATEVSPDHSNHLGLGGVLVTWLVADEIHVLTIAVRDRSRRRGAARALLDHAFASCKAKGARKVFLEVRRDNEPAIALYRRLDFTVLNTRRAYYADGCDALEMRLEWDASGARVPHEDE